VANRKFKALPCFALRPGVTGDVQLVGYESISEVGARDRKVCFAPVNGHIKLPAGRSPAGSPVTTRIT